MEKVNINDKYIWIYKWLMQYVYKNKINIYITIKYFKEGIKYKF